MSETSISDANPLRHGIIPRSPRPGTIIAATPRILIPIMEMYQNQDGTITVPDALRPYTNGQERIG